MAILAEKWSKANILLTYTFQVNIIVEKLQKGAIFDRFELIWPCCDLEMTLPWPWGNSHMKPNLNPCHHVYLCWVPTDLLEVLGISQNVYFLNIFQTKPLATHSV